MMTTGFSARLMANLSLAVMVAIGAPRFVAGQTPRDSSGQPRVIVSRELVRIILPGRGPGGLPPTRLNATISTPNTGLLVRADIPPAMRVNDSVGVCRQLSTYLRGCDSTTVTMTVRNDGFVLEIDDSTAISRLFGLRPPRVHVYLFGDVERRFGDSLTVEYIAPQLPIPDSAFRARQAVEASERERLDRRVSHHIAPASNLMVRSGPLRLSVGDSIALTVTTMTCTHPCAIGAYVEPVAWASSDTTVARISARSSSEFRTGGGGPLVTVWLTALRAGEAKVSATGLTYDGPPAQLPIPDSASIDIRVVPR